MTLEGQVAVVTGSGRGIGKTIALRFAEAGADIAVLDVNGDTATATSEEIHRLGRKALVKQVDVSDAGAAQTAIREVASQMGRLDVLVNNAGIETRAPFLEIRPQDWQRQLDVNLSGTFYCTQAAAREMAERGYGRIVNLSSVAGLIGPIDLAAYGAAKAGIVGLTRAAALDLADFGITVNAIAPGPIETDLMRGVWTADALRERAEHAPIARFGTIDEIAHTALFLASPESGFISGVTLSVDGGAVAAGPTWSRDIAEERLPQPAPPPSGDPRTPVMEGRGRYSNLEALRKLLRCVGAISDPRALYLKEVDQEVVTARALPEPPSNHDVRRLALFGPRRSKFAALRAPLTSVACCRGATLAFVERRSPHAGWCWAQGVAGGGPLAFVERRIKPAIEDSPVPGVAGGRPLAFVERCSGSTTGRPCGVHSFGHGAEQGKRTKGPIAPTRVGRWGLASSSHASA